jgi:hypothetical protein
MSILRLHVVAASAGAALTAVGLVLIAGCGDDTGLDKRYPVSGTVTYNDKPVEKGQISFIPADPGKQRPANGFIENGRFTLTTATSGDGALPGNYRVTIKAVQTDDSKIIETVVKKGGGGRQQDIAKATANAKLLVPPKYQLPETSELEAKVEEKSNTFDWKLTD